MLRIASPELRKQATKRLIELSRQEIELCLQCGKCTSGCTFASDMDLMPHQIVHLAQLGMTDMLTGCEAIWFCATCFTCESRCPVEIDIAALAEAIRLLACLDGDEGFGPEQVPRDVVREAPQQALVSLFRKFAH